MTLEDYFWLPILEKLRQEQKQDIQMPQLQLPLPVPPYNEEPPRQDLPEDVYDRGVVIIDMFGDDEN